MKLAISNIAWPHALEPRAASLLKTAGVRGLEVAPTAIWAQPLQTPDGALDAYRDRWQADGVEIVAIQALLYGRPDLVLFGDESTRDRMAGHLVEVARVSSRLGARFMVFGSPGNRRRGDLDAASALDIATDFFRSLAPRVADLGACLCIEGNAPGYGCDFLTTTAEAADLVRRVGHPGVRLQFDLSTMAMNGEAYDHEIATHAELAPHFHASEPRLVPFGTGGTDHQAAAGALRTLGYDGWVSVEMRAIPDDPDLSGVAAALRAAHQVYGAR